MGTLEEKATPITEADKTAPSVFTRFLSIHL